MNENYICQICFSMMTQEDFDFCDICDECRTGDYE